MELQKNSSNENKIINIKITYLLIKIISIKFL